MIHMFETKIHSILFQKFTFVEIHYNIIMSEKEATGPGL